MFPGIGTVINVIAAALGGILGIFFGKLVKKDMQDSIINVIGISVLFVGIGGAMEKMLIISEEGLSSRGTLMMIFCIVIGTFLGELIGIDRGFERFGEWLKKISGNGSDSAFLDAFLTTSFTVCIGAMAIVGSIQDGLLRDPSMLITKAVLDFVIIFLLASAMGKGCIFSAIPIGILQGTVTLCASLLKPLMTETALAYLSLTGSVLIFCVGVNLLWPKKLKVANMLPTVVLAVIWALVEGRFS